ncbi:hypothetical protein ACJX0J_038449, partial [Zea mays]
MAEVLIGSLMIGNCSDRLCVRVSRMWEFYDPQDESKLLQADMVLIDEEGGSAHAQIYPPLAVVFKPMIKEGNVYNVSYVQIKKANRMYKPVNNDIMIGFTKWTTIEELIEVPPAFLEIVYSLTPFDQLTTLVDIKEYFIDVIGAVTMISDVATIRTKMRQTQTAKRSVTIQNESYTPLEVVLWGEQATSFPADPINHMLVCLSNLAIYTSIKTLCLPKVPNLSSTTSQTGGSSCKWYVNPQIPEATSLAASLQHKRSPIMSTSGSTQRVPRISTAEHKKVSEIKHLHPFKHEKVEWLVTVTVLKIDQLWWYESCRKWTPRSRNADTYKCSDSGCGHVGPPNPRYRLLITAGDETGETDFILFGCMAQRIVKKPLDILIADNPARFIPDEINRLMEKVYTFNVSFTDSTIALGNVCFQVNTVVAEIGDGGQVPISPSGSQPSSISSARAASKSTSADSVPTGGTSSQTPQSTKNYSKDKRARSPTPLSKGGSSATRQVARKILGGSTDKTGDGHDLAFIIADSRYILCLS